ncbi:alpha/beta hydrolase [Bordetella genomosp. 5]|uniref:Alpha/beta hydrolase n=1 Tax=Bordetella genomosp. 5 TaxID=1395608 RepID=A0A261TR34_9BORD|nr:alpha/beta fold hydrolase [Bordetella genomosp. 5]OZI52124.1 alpha/beta hydrolase [Bordetella genomosp. 5]
MPRPFLPAFTRSRRARIGLTTLFALALSACSAPRAPQPAENPPSFAEYQRATQARLLERRAFQTATPEQEVAWNSPQEWRPEGATGSDGFEPHGAGLGARAAKGILLIHGLGDSPWSFTDVARTLAQQGFLVRTVLLPGHGTRPEDLLDTTAEQWRAVVRAQAIALQRDVDTVYLGGFSTGANLALEYAYEHPEIAGLVLFSPGFKSSSTLDWLAPWVTWIRPWLLAPDGHRPMQNDVRYLTAPTNAFGQFYLTSRTARRLIHDRPYERPVFMVLAQHDSVLDTPYLLDVFQRRFVHAASRLVWYGDLPGAPADAGRVLVRPDRLPAQRISQFSHMGMLFAPGNPLYGAAGSLRICWNGQEPAQTEACLRGEPVWYSDWGYREAGKVHARLTYNPYFDWQTSVMAEVLKAAAAEPGAVARR